MTEPQQSPEELTVSDPAAAEADRRVRDLVETIGEAIEADEE